MSVVTNIDMHWYRRRPNKVCLRKWSVRIRWVLDGVQMQLHVGTRHAVLHHACADENLGNVLMSVCSGAIPRECEVLS